jgi:hypothetical protein
MKRTIAVLSTVLVFAAWAQPASAAVGRVSPEASFKGRDLASWQRSYMSWVLGSADSPVVAGGCGAVVDGVFFLAPAAVPGTTEVECEVPTGMPILVLAGVAFSEIPTWGDTDAAVLADARATWSNVTGTSVTLDGRSVSLEGTYREGGVYDVPIEAGSVMDVACEGVPAPCKVDFEPPGPVRMATVGQFVVLRPLPPRTHHIVAETDIFGLQLILSATVHVR